MPYSRTEQTRHSTSALPESPRAAQWPRFLRSLALLGFLFGLMLGDLLHRPPELLAVEPFEQGLRLRFDGRPTLEVESYMGTLALIIEARAIRQAGQLQIGSMLVNWRLTPRSPEQATLGLIAARPLQAHWTERETAEGDVELSLSLFRAGPDGRPASD